MAFPGPFDYEKGICQIQGLNKYDSIYGRALEPEMKKRIPEIENARFGYLHDIEAFAVGEAWFGEMQNESKIVCLCIGTGTGTAFLKDKVPQKSGEGVPECGWLYWLPYKDSIIDDYISVRGLERICKEVFGEPKSGKELYDLCQKGDETALKAWKKFGDDIIAAILPVIEDFHPDAIIFGGQISKSFTYFGKEFAEECEKRNIKIHVQTETSEKAMQDFHPDAIIFGGQISKSFTYFGKEFAEECEKRNIKIHVQTETSEKAMQGLFVKMTRG